jgi:hypothetical protein
VSITHPPHYFFFVSGCPWMCYSLGFQNFLWIFCLRFRGNGWHADDFVREWEQQRENRVSHAHLPPFPALPFFISVKFCCESDDLSCESIFWNVPFCAYTACMRPILHELLKTMVILIWRFFHFKQYSSTGHTSRN